MGILNATPDSFSDGGRFLNQETALIHARHLIAEGADILDIGGESTRPNASAVSVDEELDRVVPIIEAIHAECDIRLSIDTMKPAVARAAVAAGASIWNDVTALTYEAHSPSTAADLGCDVVLMHMRGDPRSMAGLAHYGDVVADVCAELRLRAKNAVAAGVDPKMIWLDPGLGFAKTAEQSLALLQNLKILVDLGHRVLVGASRKSFLRTLDPAAVDPADRLAASLAAARLAAGSGATAVRVHDVWETVQALT